MSGYSGTCPCDDCEENRALRARIAELEADLDNQSIAHESTKLTLAQVDAQRDAAVASRDAMRAEVERRETVSKLIRGLFMMTREEFLDALQAVRDAGTVAAPQPTEEPK